MRTIVAAFAMAVLLFTANNFAQSANNKINENTYRTLYNAVKSENVGLKKSGIYQAGFYRVEVLVDELIKILRTEKREDIKILAALSLYKIGNTKGMEAVQEFAIENKPNKFNNMCKALVNQYAAENEAAFR